jgi:GNAT superfamily N-acetyltransferase
VNQQLALCHYDAQAVRPLIDRLVAIYVGDVYADDPVFSNEDNFRQQLDKHMTQPGWELITANVNDEIAGYIYGFTLTSETDWWHGLVTAVSEDFTTEDGERTLAISELLVRTRWRRQGVATALQERLLVDRPEKRATLLVQPSYEAAQAAYAKWGWRKTGQLQPSWQGAPLYDVMILPLGGGSA